MRRINIPKPITIRLNFGDESPSQKDTADDLKIIDSNCSEVITGATWIEDRMIEGLSTILVGTDKEKKEYKEYFTDEIIGTSDFSYAFKRRAFTRALERFKLLSPEKIKELKAGLNKIMQWRNAFAHGKVIKNFKGGYVLKYYSGGHKEEKLNNEFFEEVESTFRNCLMTCNGVIQRETK